MDIRITFVDTEGYPYFESPVQTIAFHENSTGRDEMQEINEALDPLDAGKEEGEPREKIYYFIDQTYNPEDSKYFALDKDSRIVTLIEDLDRETIDVHHFRVIASRTEDRPPVSPEDYSMVLVTVTVLDVNDNNPIFESYNYGVGITTSDYVNKLLLTVKANDADLDDIVTYHLLPDTFERFGENLDNIDMSGFILNIESGSLYLNFIPQLDMTGYFEFVIQANDLGRFSKFLYV